MRPRPFLALLTLLPLLLILAAAAQAAVVGRFTLVEGQVDLLKQGKIPAVAARVNDGVEPGDVIRTKSKARAQVRFLDDSVVTLAPESRLAVADFEYEPATGQRHAVLRFFKGVMHTVVSRVLRVEQPDFLTETHTAVMGVRGTEYYSVLLPNATGAYLINGLLEVRSISRQVPESVLLKDYEFTMVPLGQQVQLPRQISPAMLGMLKTLMNTGLGQQALLGTGAAVGGGGPQIPEVLGFPGALEPKLPYIPPQVVPPPVQPPAPTAPARGGGTPGSVIP